MLAVEELLGNHRGNTAEQVSLAVDDDLFLETRRKKRAVFAHTSASIALHVQHRHGHLPPPTTHKRQQTAETGETYLKSHSLLFFSAPHQGNGPPNKENIRSVYMGIC